MSREPRVAIPQFPAPGPAYDAQNETAYRRAVEETLRSLAHNTAEVPEVQVTASRSGASATVTLAVRDRGRRVTAIEFNKREGTGAATGWVSAWDTTTGTIGTDPELARSESVSIPAGLDSAFEWRLTYRDQFGAEFTKGGSVPTANLASVNKSLVVPYSLMVPISNTEPFDVASGYLTPGGTLATRTYVCGVVLPQGVQITNFSARLYVQSTSDSAYAALWKGSNTTGLDTRLAEAIHSEVGAPTWETASAAVSPTVTVGQETYGIVVQLYSQAAAANSAFLWGKIDYTAPDYSKTY